MKRKILALCLAVSMMFGLASCGNYDTFDFVYTYNYAVVKWPDGSVKEIEIRSWTDYEGEQIQITDINGTVYLLSSVNCVLIKK